MSAPKYVRLLHEAIFRWQASGGGRAARLAFKDVDAAIVALVEHTRQRARHDAAKIADLYADVNIEAAGDTILADPVMSGRDHSPAAFAKSNELTIEGCIHSSMFHAAKNIAAAIREGSVMKGLAG